MLFVFAAAILQRLAVIRCVTALLATGGLLLQSARGADLIDLRPGPAAGSYRQIKVVIAVEGKLKLNANGQEVTHLPLSAHAELEYLERAFPQSSEWSDTRLIRAYRKAQAKIRLREADLVSALRDSRGLVVVETSQSPAVHFSLQGPLTREELELIQAPASGVALEALLPHEAVKIAGQWPLADDRVTRLLGLEAVSQQQVACTLDSIKDEIAIITLEGTVAGAIGGVSSDIELKGKLNFDLRKRLVTWFVMACKENRAIGHAQPGFEALTTVRLIAAPAQAAAELSDKALAGLPLKAGDGQTLLELTVPAAGFQLMHDRRWQVMAEQHDATVLRLIDRGDLVAQCNISPRPRRDGQQLTLEGFQDDVRRTLGKNFEQVVEASEQVNEAGIQVLRVVAAGTVGELPIQWMYYHLTDAEGRRAALVFTIETGLVERFAQIDRELVAGFQFLAAAEPTLATPR